MSARKLYTFVDRNLDRQVVELVDELNTHEALTIAHGTTGNVVGTSDTQTLSNKTFSNIVKFQDKIVLPKASGYGIEVDTVSPSFGWRDLLGIMRPDPGGANSPVLAAVRGGLCREFFYGANDKLDLDFHIPHDYLKGSDVFLHIHWGHIGTAISGNFVVTFTHTYAKGHNQAIFPAEKAVVMTYNTVDITTTPQYIHRIDEIQLSVSGGSSTQIDTALLEPDGVIMLDMTATTIPTITGGGTNKPFICYTDIHYQSTSIATKQRAPDFYV